MGVGLGSIRGSGLTGRAGALASGLGFSALPVSAWTGATGDISESPSSNAVSDMGPRTCTAGASFDLVVFNASLHYAEDLGAALGEARRVARVGARLVVLDSPFYASETHGEAMVREKHANAEREFGTGAPTLLAM